MNSTLEMVLRILLAAALGAVIGWQREKAHKPAGLRTHILISMGAALFTIISISTSVFPTADPSRIAAGIVTGVGFLGAGTILHHTRFIEGLTTAASIWIIAAVGTAAGAGLYVISAIATLIVFVVLLLPHPDSDENNNR